MTTAVVELGQVKNLAAKLTAAQRDLDALRSKLAAEEAAEAQAGEELDRAERDLAEGVAGATDRVVRAEMQARACRLRIENLRRQVEQADARACCAVQCFVGQLVRP